MQLTERALNISHIMINIGAGFVSSSTTPSRPIVKEVSNTAIAVDWFRVTENTNLKINKFISKEANYQCNVELPANSVNINLGSSVNVIVSAFFSNRFVFNLIITVLLYV